MSLKLTSGELTEDRIEQMEGDNNLADRLFPTVPIFTVCMAIAYFGVNDEDPDGNYPIIESTNLLIRAANANAAIEKAVIATVHTLEEDDIEHYTMSIVGAFEGEVPDLSNDYEPSQEILDAEHELDSDT